jgi:hypothetical protein
MHHSARCMIAPNADFIHYNFYNSLFMGIWSFGDAISLCFMLAQHPTNAKT